MAKSGMRYQGVLNLIKEIEEKKDQIVKVTATILNDRTAEVAKVYGGTSAESFKAAVTKNTEEVENNINSIIKQLNEEAQVQHDNYQKQEQALKR